MPFGTPFVNGSNLHKGMEKFAEVVNAETKGRIKIPVYTGSQIGDIQQLMTGMQLGTSTWPTSALATAPRFPPIGRAGDAVRNIF
ncbi:MAG: hypothetical protein WKH97_00330 [Casimicrobiaceae bacterium]